MFATDHEVGDKIMRDVYRTAAARFPRMRAEIRARQRDSLAAHYGMESFWSNEDLLRDAPLGPREVYERVPSSPPYNRKV